MPNTYIQYYKQNKLCVYRTLKSYAKFKAKSFVSAKFNGFLAFVSNEADKGLKITTNA